MKERIDRQTRSGVCVYCSSPLVQPTEWNQDSDELWWVTLRCPECFRNYDKKLTQEQVHEFTLEIEDGFRLLLEAIEQLDQEAFEAECQLIIKALNDDNLYPMDF